MDKLQNIFLSEAHDLILDLERALLSLEVEPEGEKGVQEVFRVMHTLKGSGSMFGFDSLSAFTHDLETIYDKIRNNEIALTSEILEVTLKSVDHLKNLIHDPGLTREDLVCDHKALLERISLIGSSTSGPSLKGPRGTSVFVSYYLFITFKADVLKNGTNPLYLIDDLLNLGQGIVFPRMDDVPSVVDIVTDRCYSTFELLLVTNAGTDAIREVFIFCEDQCDLQIEQISESNVLNNLQLLDALKASSIGTPPFGWELVRKLAGNSDRVVKVSKAVASREAESTSIRVSSDKLDELMNLVSELVTSQARLTLIAEEAANADLINLSENIEKITRRLRDNAFTICLVPIESLVTRFQRLVRDLAKELGKEIDFVAEGTETELDKSIIEKVTDPILHILRNCIDHGLELPEERITVGKNRKGKIELKAYHSGTNVFIEIKDDGRGIDPEKIRSKAVSQGLISQDAVLSEKEILELIFMPGFSTAAKVTDVSGRGVGMDIVKKNIESIHGEVSVQSKAFAGTCITIKLPLTLSIMDGMLVRIGASNYVIPLTMVDKCFEMPSRKVEATTVQKHAFDGALLPVFNLRHAFEEGPTNDFMTQVIKVKYEEFPVAIMVDAIIGEYQAVMKPLGAAYRGQDEFSGATILGDGTVALVMDTDKMIRQLIERNEMSIAN